jgi:EAL domain-containing protein (putative c-di-GMP-specific phosphodiesterase class I)
MTVSAARRVTPADLLGEADLALYRAKDSGRDRVVVYDDALRARARNRHRIERMLRSAIADHRLALQYQPVVDFAHGRVIGAEALVRIQDTYGGHLLTPDTFIAVAEDTGLIVDLDCWVIATALEQLAKWTHAGRGSRPGPWLSLNLSARSLDHPKVGEHLIRTLDHWQLDPSLLKVELTEHSFLKALPTGEETLRQWVGRGINVGIDDFGTGYSALAYLERFPLQFMKIDRTFIAAVGVQDRADAVVTAIVDLAHAHGMSVVAEGVETSRQARRLREIGCDHGQGHHFGRPGDPQRILKV